MKFSSKEVARSYLINDLHDLRLMISDLEIVDDVPTAHINLVTRVVKIGWKFLCTTIRDINDLKFLIQHEVTHRFICNQWNKQRLIDTISKVAPNGYRYEEIDWSIINIIEDSFINNWIVNSGRCVSDFPDYYYKTNNYETIWLKKSGEFSPKNKKSKLQRRAAEDRNRLLWSIRFNKDFFYDLGSIAAIYWLIFLDKKREQEEGGGGKGGGDSKQTEPMPIDSTDDPTPGGTEQNSGSKSQEKAVEEQRKQEEEASSGAGKEAYNATKKYVPDVNKDMDLAKAFDIFNVEMEEMEGVAKTKTKFSNFLDGILEKARCAGPNHYASVAIPNRVSRHDMIMMGAFGQRPVYMQHELPERGKTQARWNIYLDCSISMRREVPVGRYVANRIKDQCNKMYNFSVGDPIEYDGGSYIWTRGATDMIKCFEHCYRAKIDHMIVIGDAKDVEYGFNYMSRPVKKWAREAETVMLVVDKSPSWDYIRLAQTVFKYVYVLDSDELLKGNFKRR